MQQSTDTTVVLRDTATVDLGNPNPKPTSLDGDVHEALLQAWTSTIVDAQAGVWEATEGSFAAARDGYDEICVITNGRVTVVPDGGKPITLSPGDLLVTPCGWRGIWHVHEQTRKVYVIIRKNEA
jgi:uncharacterized cupin superfamily protein